MKPFDMRTIIVTTDFSGPSLNAARYAAGLAGPLGVDQLVLYHSYDNAPLVTDAPVAEDDVSLAYEGSLLALEMVENEMRAVSDRPASVKILLVTNELPLVLGVERLAEQWEPCLVVAATTGKGGLEKFAMGSNTSALALSCAAPLLVVPREARYDAIERIVFACDLKKVSKTTPVAELRFLLERLHAELLVLNVAVEGKRFDPDVIPEQYKLHDLLDDLDPTYHYTESDDLVEGIADFAEDQRAGLIVSVPKAHGFLERLFRRSVSTALIDKTETPLLLLKEKE